MNVCVLVEVIKETAKNWRFIFEDPLADEIKFLPGQLVQLVAKPGEEGAFIRNYSVASSPDGTNRFELIITNLEGGQMSDHLFKEAEIMTEFLYRGPMGVFTLTSELETRPYVFVSTGSGISPFRSMMKWIDEKNIKFDSIKLYFGTRTEEDLLYREELEAIQERHPNFQYFPTLSREIKKGIPHGYVHEHYLKYIDSLDVKPLVYFCGWNRMIEEGRNHLAERGFVMQKDIKVEIFG